LRTAACLSTADEGRLTEEAVVEDQVVLEVDVLLVVEAEEADGALGHLAGVATLIAADERCDRELQARATVAGDQEGLAHVAVDHLQNRFGAFVATLLAQVGELDALQDEGLGGDAEALGAGLDLGQQFGIGAGQGTQAVIGPDRHALGVLVLEGERRLDGAGFGARHRAGERQIVHHGTDLAGQADVPAPADVGRVGPVALQDDDVLESMDVPGLAVLDLVEIGDGLDGRLDNRALGHEAPPRMCCSVRALQSGERWFRAKLKLRM